MTGVPGGGLSGPFRRRGETRVVQQNQEVQGLAKEDGQVLFVAEDDIPQCISYQEAVRICEEVLREQGLGNVEMPPKQLLNLRKHGLDSYANSMPGYLKYLDIAGIKWGGGFGANLAEKRLPYMIQTIILASPVTGMPFTMMSATHITSLKTGSETAVVGKYLANTDQPMKVTIIGLGAQGSGAIEAWLALHQLGDLTVEEFRFVDVSNEAIARAVKRVEGRFNGRVIGTRSVEEGTRGADAIVTATHAEEPLIKGEWLKRGVYIGSLGSYPEVDPDWVMAADKRYVDNWVQNEHRGEFCPLIEAGKLTRANVVGEVTDLVAGRIPGRERPDENIIASLIGLGSIDLGMAKLIYQNAKDKGLGQFVKFMSC